MNSYDIVVIGAGPAGLMAAGCASEQGARVLVLEKNSSAGIKLLMTGGGRCNFTNTAPNNLLAASFGQNGRWLLSGLSRFNSADIINFFALRGVKIKVNEEGKVFPENSGAYKIREVLIDYVELNGGVIQYDAKVIKIIKDNNLISKIILADRSEIKADKFIIACGGNSYPLSGSSGDAYSWLKDLGHNAIKPKPALAPIILHEQFIKILEGLSFPHIKLDLYQGLKKIATENGPLIFTARGISGPVSLNLSRFIANENKANLKLVLDFFPNQDKNEIEKKLQILIDLNSKESIRNILAKLISKRLADLIILNQNIDTAKKGSEINKIERGLIVSFLKNLNLTILALGSFDEAMITSGGVDLKEVDQKTMASKQYKNLYFAGEILDLDGPTGGYNLQVAWTSGYVAGSSASLK